jgi:putative membrane protein
MTEQPDEAGSPPGVQMREKSANQLSLDRTDLATKRNIMAADRSLMAWIRTALSMISFGFTIYKLLEGFQKSGADLANASSPRNMGLFLTGMGTASMVLGTVEYWLRLRDLQGYKTFDIWRPCFIMALVMSVFGLFMFVAIISRVL